MENAVASIGSLDAIIGEIINDSLSMVKLYSLDADKRISTPRFVKGITWAIYASVGTFLISVAFALYIRVSNHISATTYNQTPVSQEWKELWSPFLCWLIALVKCWSHTKSKVFMINHVWARDKNVHLSDLCNYQTFVPNFRQLVPSPLKMMCRVPDLEHMTTYLCCHWPPNFSPQCCLNQTRKHFCL